MGRDQFPLWPKSEDGCRRRGRETSRLSILGFALRKVSCLLHTRNAAIASNSNPGPSLEGKLVDSMQCRVSRFVT